MLKGLDPNVQRSDSATIKENTTLGDSGVNENSCRTEFKIRL